MNEFAIKTRPLLTNDDHRQVSVKMNKYLRLFLGVWLLSVMMSTVLDAAEKTSAVFKTNIDQTINAKGADAKIKDAFLKGRSDLWVTSQGTVVKVLKDDNDGSRHQRFLLQLSNGHTVLIAHNIDLAPRIPNLNNGDTVVFYGEYEWNIKGGVIHWTHRDPLGYKTGGWLVHKGKRYE